MDALRVILYCCLLRDKGHQVMIWDRLTGQVKYSFDKEKVNQAMQADIHDFQPDLIGFNTVGPFNL